MFHEKTSAAASSEETRARAASRDCMEHGHGRRDGTAKLGKLGKLGPRPLTCDSQSPPPRRPCLDAGEGEADEGSWSWRASCSRCSMTDMAILTAIVHLLAKKWVEVNDSRKGEVGTEYACKRTQTQGDTQTLPLPVFPFLF